MIRPAALSDLKARTEYLRTEAAEGINRFRYIYALQQLYAAEWRKRGFLRSP